MIDILILAIITIIIIYKLLSVIGRDVGRPVTENILLTKELDKISETKRIKNTEKDKFDSEFWEKPIGQTTLKILGNFTFSPFDFLKGAKGAFEMIYDSYQKGDLTVFSMLMTKPVAEKFIKNIKSYEELNEKLHINLIGIDHLEIQNIRLQDEIIKITVQFNSKQIFWITNKNEEVIEGNKDLIHHVKDVWVFEKHINSTSKLWLLSQVSD